MIALRDNFMNSLSAWQFVKPVTERGSTVVLPSMLSLTFFPPLLSNIILQSCIKIKRLNYPAPEEVAFA